MTGSTESATRGPDQRVHDHVLSALDAVHDPELHAPVTSLGFVSTCRVEEGHAEVHLRLPTYFCAPNFAFLMVADAHDAVAGTTGVTEARVLLEDHFAAEAINAGVAAGSGFAESFEGEARAELDELRTLFLRKAVLAGTDLVCRSLTERSRTPEELVALDLGDVEAGPDLARLRERRRELGLPAGDEDPLLLDVETGERLPAESVTLHLRRARVTRVGVEANTSMCRGMLAHRYDITEDS